MQRSLGIMQTNTEGKDLARH